MDLKPASFKDMQERAWRVRQRYSELEKLRHGRSWTREEIALGFVGDVGDLAKLVQAAEGVRDIPDAKAKLAHELADCLWSIMTLAQLYEIELEASFLATMTELESGIDAQISSAS